MQTANMSREQELEFWQQKTEQLREVLRKIRELGVNLKVVDDESLIMNEMQKKVLLAMGTIVLGMLLWPPYTILDYRGYVNSTGYQQFSF